MTKSYTNDQDPSLYQQLIENLPEPFFLFNKAGKHLLWNSAMLEVSGYSAEEYAVLTPLDMFDTTDTDKIRSAIDDAFTDGKGAITIPIKHKNGHKIPMRFTATRVVYMAEPCLYGVGIDLSEDNSKLIAIEESERRFRSLVQEGSDLIAILDAHGNYKYVSPTAINVLGMTPDEYMSVNAFDLIHPDDVAETFTKFQSVIDNKRVKIEKFRFKHKDESWRWLETIATNMLDDPSVEGIVANSRDITDRIELERNLKEAQQVLNSATLMARIGGWSVDVINDRHVWSFMTREIHEVPADFNPKSMHEAISFYREDYRPELTRIVNKAIENGQSFSFEMPIITAKGNERWVRAKGNAEYKEGVCVRIFGSFQDIDREKKAELALEQAYQERINILESIGDAFFAVDRDWTVTYWNKEAENVLFKKREEIVGKNLWVEYADAVGLDFYKMYHKAMDSGETVTFEEHYPTLNKWFEVTAYPSEKGLSIYFKDVSIRKHAEESVKKANETLQAYVTELSKSNEELEKFAFVASHDLQEPLRMISSFLALLEKKYSNSLDRKALQYINFAIDGANRMRTIILDLLEYSRVNRFDDEPDLIDLNLLVNDICKLYKNQISSKKARITYPSLPIIKFSKTPLLQIFNNLIGNALKYYEGDDTPTISISYEEHENEIQFGVHDNGIGIDPNYHDKIFIIFQRLHTRDKYSGTGMGLAIVKKSVEHAGGRVWVESEQGKGSSFYFTLPVKAVH
jgi:PAS domain S-box-containing protein